MLRMTCGLVLLLSVCPMVRADDGQMDKFEAEAARRMATLTKHFRLNEEQQDWLRDEIYRRMDLAREHDRELTEFSDRLREQVSKPGYNPEETTKWLAAHRERDPLSFGQLKDALRTQIPEDQFENGGRAAAGAQIRSANTIKAMHEQKEARSLENQRNEKRILAGEAAAAPVRPTQQHDPRMLQGKNNDRNANQPRDIHVTAKSAPTNNARVNKATEKLSDWEKLVRDAAIKYDFTDAQKRTAQGMLDDVERRATSYRKVHETDYDRANLIKDAKERSEKIARLDKPLTALERELSERLELIPSRVQRATAEAKSAPKGKSKGR